MQALQRHDSASDNWTDMEWEAQAVQTHASTGSFTAWAGQSKMAFHHDEISSYLSQTENWEVFISVPLSPARLQ